MPNWVDRLIFPAQKHLILGSPGKHLASLQGQAFAVSRPRRFLGRHSEGRSPKISPGTKRFYFMLPHDDPSHFAEKFVFTFMV